MGRIFDSLVGASEAHMRNAIAVSEAVSPCILWIDEIEKGLSRPGQQVGDSGVSLRVLGTFLTWLQEKTSPVFVVATANDILHLPPEIVRKGRFDAVFFVDLSDEDERRAILDIHLKRVDRADDPLDLDALVELSGSSDGLDRGGMTGAEIAAWVDDAMLYAFERSLDGEAPDLSHEDFVRALDEMPILAKIRDKDIAALRGWATAHAQPAS
jgi:SpoVK/Ycf46/Vps4 family AAA+-type ATPase